MCHHGWFSNGRLHPTKAAFLGCHVIKLSWRPSQSVSRSCCCALAGHQMSLCVCLSTWLVVCCWAMCSPLYLSGGNASFSSSTKSSCAVSLLKYQMCYVVCYVCQHCSSLPACLQSIFPKPSFISVSRPWLWGREHICSHGHLLESLIIVFNVDEDSSLQDSEGLN